MAWVFFLLNMLCKSNSGPALLIAGPNLMDTLILFYKSIKETDRHTVRQTDWLVNVKNSDTSLVYSMFRKEKNKVIICRCVFETV